MIVFFRALLLYIVVIIAVRLMGKRQLGDLQPSEMVTTILIGNIAAIPIEDTTLPMLVRYTNEETVVLSVFNGIICSAAVPVLISLCY